MAAVSKRRPRAEKLFAACVRREFTQNPEELRLMVLAAIAKSKGGDMMAFKILMEAIDGKPHQSIDMEVDVNDGEITTASESELLQALRDRMAGILPKRTISNVEGDREPRSGSDPKTH